ncbi:MAG: sulfite exporter TauE/SafE family protein [Alphaproteobacteria bacterium]|nr:sulfite exporter TauE/SafE family protein [Alphaproteobacteria bacterium]
MSLGPALPLLGAAALAGVAGTPHCIGMCGGFAVACGDRPSSAAAWHVGRLLTYAILGAGAGALGGSVPGPGWAGTFVAVVLLVWFSGRLAGVFPAAPIPTHRLVGAGGALLRQAGFTARFSFGLLNGLLPCGLVYAALALPVSSADPALGAALMLAFGLGTVPGLSVAMYGLRRFAIRSIWGRRALGLGVLALGVGALFIRMPAPDAAPGDPPPCHTPAE